MIERISLAEDGEPPFLPSRFASDGVEAKRLVLSTSEFRERLPLDDPGKGEDADDNEYPLLIFDQFEELITLFEEAPESRRSSPKLHGRRRRSLICSSRYCGLPVMWQASHRVW